MRAHWNRLSDGRILVLSLDTQREKESTFFYSGVWRPLFKKQRTTKQNKAIIKHHDTDREESCFLASGT